VCLVSHRLEVRQKYIFDCVLSLFGRDLGDNIYLMLTFADGGIRADGLPFKDYGKFSNSDIFASNSPGSPDFAFTRMFWDMGQRSMFYFFDAVLPSLPSQSLSLIRDTTAIGVADGQSNEER
jgi:hypothetical protein